MHEVLVVGRSSNQGWRGALATTGEDRAAEWLKSGAARFYSDASARAGRGRGGCTHDSGRRRPWHPWAELMRRVNRLEVLTCPWCHGRRKLLAFLTNPDVIRKILDWLRLPLDPQPRVQARDSRDVVPAW